MMRFKNVTPNGIGVGDLVRSINNTDCVYRVLSVEPPVGYRSEWSCSVRVVQSGDSWLYRGDSGTVYPGTELKILQRLSPSETAEIERML